jgi:hypothetical protein
MAKKNIDTTEANKLVKETYAELSPIIKETVDKHSRNIDAVIKKIDRDAENTMTNKEIRQIILELQIEIYTFAPVKDLALFRQDLAKTLSNEAQANVYNSTMGTQDYRKNTAIADTIDKQVVKMLYDAIARQMNTKLDEAHRMVSVLNNILISRSADAKLKGQTGYDDTYDNTN